MNFEKFVSLYSEYNLIPVYEIITADLLTPVMAYLKIREKNSNSFLLESVEGIGRLARYSFIGKNPSKIISNKGLSLTVYQNGKTQTLECSILEYLKTCVSEYNHPFLPELPYFSGGIVGYFGYENIALIENSIIFTGKDELNTPDSIFGIYDTIIAFDHFKHQIILINNVFVDNSKTAETQYSEAKSKIAALKMELSSNIGYKSDFKISDFL